MTRDMRNMQRAVCCVLGSTVALAVWGCMGTPGELASVLPPEDAVGTLRASPTNAVLAVGGAVQLSVTARSLAGTPMTTFDSVAYRLGSAGDSVRMLVGATGLVTGLASSGATSLPVNVLAFRKGTWNGDQVLITVTPTTITGITLSIQPPPGDSAKLSRGTAKTITPILQNPTTGQSLTGIQLQYLVPPEEVARVGVFRGAVPLSGVSGAATVHTPLSPAATRNQILPYVAEGATWISAIVNVYGTLLQDSVRYTWSYPYIGTIRVVKRNLALQTTLSGGTAIATPVNPDITLASGGTVTFTSGVASGDPLTLAFTFDNPVAATVATPPASAGGTTGNLTALTAGQSSTRKFLTAGTYHWTWVTAGGPAPWAGQTSTGTIMVK